MKDFQTLKFLDLFRGLFEKLDINYPILRKILAVKFTMDGRRTPTLFNQQQASKKRKLEENGFIKSLGMYGLFSLLLIPVVLFGNSLFYQMSLFFGIIMFLVMTSMISDFSNVLLDVRDKGILLTKPVDKKTLNMAKTIHIGTYLFFLTAALTTIPLIVGTVKHGVLYLLLSLIGVILVDLFIVVITALIYYFILRFFDGEKLKDIINYVQIGLSITIAIGYQVLSRTFSMVDFEMTYSPSWWHFLLPPMWFGAPFEWVINHQSSGYIIALTALALLIPIVALFTYSRMMPTFERNLQKLSNNSGNSVRKESWWKNGLANIICRSREEQIFFRFADRMMRNEREFRLKVYPSLGLSLILPFIFMFNEIQLNSFDHLRASKWYLAIYASSLMIPNAVMMLKYSGKHKGAWIYKTVPLKDLAPLSSAALKVFIVNLFLPVYLILAVIFIGVFGVKVIDDVLVVFVTAIVYTVICSINLKGSPPFSEAFNDFQQMGGIQLFLGFFILAIFAGIHLAISLFPFGVPIYLLLLIVATVFVWKWVYRRVWSV